MVACIDLHGGSLWAVLPEMYVHREVAVFVAPIEGPQTRGKYVNMVPNVHRNRKAY